MNLRRGVVLDISPYEVGLKGLVRILVDVRRALRSKLRFFSTLYFQYIGGLKVTRVV
jgi:hypothetical protein